MQIRKLSIFILLVVVAAAGPALASEEFCISFDGIPGSGGPCQGNESRAYEYHHLAAREMNSGVPGQLRHQQIIVTKMTDQADPVLWDRLVTGALIPEVVIESPAAGGARVRFTYTLTNVRILGMEPIIPHTQDPGNEFIGDQTRVRIDYQTMIIRIGTVESALITP